MFFRSIAASPPSALSHLKTRPAIYDYISGGVFNMEPLSAWVL
jgi:hypothetical protein